MPLTATDPDPDPASAAGEWLVSLCSRTRTSYKEDTWHLTALEKEKFDEVFELYHSDPSFQRCHVQALRASLRRLYIPDYKFVRKLLNKDVTGRLLANENDMLQEAIRSAKVSSDLLGRPRGESCPEIVPIIELLVEHGASADCVDVNGASPLSCACVLGHMGLFRHLVDLGADLTTEYPKARLGDEADDGTKINLLQVTLDAFLSPQHIVNMDWVSWPPGVNFEMWEDFDPDETWGGIILHLVQEGLPYSKDDAGLIKLLHHVSYQGNLDYVRKLLDLGVPVDMPGPRSADGGQGEGALFATALHAAAANRQVPVARLLLARGLGPSVRRICANRYMRNRAASMTPTEVAIGAIGDDKSAIAAFLEALMEYGTELVDEDYQAMIRFGVQYDNLGFVKKLLERGCSLPLISVIGSAEMGQLLRSHKVPLDAAAVQTEALERSNLGVLRWCVKEYGPRLPSDPKAWGEVAKGSMSHLPTVKYLVSEYPGPGIDQVFIASSFQYKSLPVQTNWLLLSISHGREDLPIFFLEAGANQMCPGLTDDAATALRREWNERSTRHDWIRERLQVIKLIESRISGGDAWAPPTLAQLKQRIARAVAKQRLAWDRRTTRLSRFRDEVPFQDARQNQTRMNQESSVDRPIYPYTSLAGKSSFRLLDLLPSTDPLADIACRLRHSDIVFQPEYEALSYVWGTDPPARSIAIDGYQVPIRSNLLSALLRLRHVDKVRTLWIDALCIDQSTFTERNQQVSIMGDIFKSARQVIVWLGEESAESRLAFSWIRSFEKFKKKPRESAARLTRTLAERSALRALFKLPWFFRIWVIQEIGLSRAAIVMCGGDSAEWPSLLYWGHGRMQEHHPFVGFDSKVHLAQLDHIRRRVPNIETLHLVELSCRCQTSEVKDRIYGLLGLFRPGFIPIDYSLPLERIFAQFTEAVIRRDNSLAILKIVNNGSGQRLDNLPSWVPNYTSPRTIGVLSYRMWSHPDYHKRDKPLSCTLPAADGAEATAVLENFPRQPLPGLEFRDGTTVLVLRGKLLETIRAVGPLLPNEPNFIPGAAGFADVLRAWESLVVTVTDGFDGRVSGNWKPKQPGETKFPTAVTAAFAYTLAASTDWNIHSIPVGFAQWYRHCGQGVLEASDPSGFLHQIEFYLWWRGIGREDQDQDSHDRGSDGGGNDDLPPGGDEVDREGEVDEEGIDFHLEQFAEQVEQACYGRCFFTTEGVTMGLGVPGAQAGDRIAFIPGADWPLLLRPCGGGGGGDGNEEAAKWTLVGDCYLYGLEPFALFEDEKHVVNEFVIR
ncbi:hypothetical protein PspLS_10082 [Pyricularia sp. CBS 133598]|nr:hypothetical protein PspLS_10082 [Pyricularia sp. CBS 133598]